MKVRYLALLLVVVALAWPQGRATVDVDTGFCLLSGTFCGGIGFTNADTGQGMGFQYPKFTPSALYYGGFLVGASQTTVHDHFYGQPATRAHWDWVVRDTFVDVVPPLYNAHELYRCSWVDTSRPTAAEGYKVTNWWGGRGDPGYDDFVILHTYITNTSGSNRTGVYVGVFCDFDLGTAATTNYGFSDPSKRLAFMTPTMSNHNPTVGVRLLAPTTASNLALIDHALYVYPATQMTELTKINFLNGTIRMPRANRAYDWSICVAAGPFNINAGDSVRVAFAIVGGSDTASMKAHSDTAQAWYDRDWVTGIAEERTQNLTGTEIRVYPNPFNRSTRIFYTMPTKGKLVIKAYDESGREVASIADRYVDQSGHVDWKAGDLPNGVYFLRVETPQNNYTRKVLLLK